MGLFNGDNFVKFKHWCEPKVFAETRLILIHWYLDHSLKGQCTTEALVISLKQEEAYKSYQEWHA